MPIEHPDEVSSDKAYEVKAERQIRDYARAVENETILKEKFDLVLNEKDMLERQYNALEVRCKYLRND